MTYEKHTWVCDEDITDELLNNMEDGIERATESAEPLLVHAIPDESGEHLDKTFGEIRTAFYSGRNVLFIHDSSAHGDVSASYSLVIYVHYWLEAGEHDADGYVHMPNLVYEAHSPIKTLEALDAQYPYIES